MPAATKKLHENQSLGWSFGGQIAQSAPRSCGVSAEVIQSAIRLAGAQPPRLNSACANSSASFGSLPDVSRVRRSSMQPTAARRAGSHSPWQEKPDKCRARSSMRLKKARQELASATPAWRSSETAPNLLSSRPDDFEFRCPAHPCRKSSTCRRIEFAARTVDFELGYELICCGGPAQNVLPAARGMSKDGVRSCFFVRICPADGERRVGPVGQAPARLGRQTHPPKRPATDSSHGGQGCRAAPAFPYRRTGAQKWRRPRR